MDHYSARAKAVSFLRRRFIWHFYPKLVKSSGSAFMPFLLIDVAGDPELNLPDGIHPNVNGHKIVAKNVMKVLDPLL